MKDERVIGLNYWPIESATTWWHRFDEAVVEEDFSRMKEAGVEVVRIFLLWEDFQPQPHKVSNKTIDHLVSVMESAYQKGLKILPTFFTGHMSGVNFLPPWMLDFGEGDDRFPIFSEGKKRRNRVQNFYKNRELREAQKFLIREISGALKGHSALWAWDLGNEPSNLVLPDSKDDALRWLDEMVSELKKVDEKVPVTLGLHQEDLEEDRKMGPEEVGRFTDFLSIHAYSIYASWADHSKDEEVVPYLGLLTQWLGSKEVLVEEVGIPSSKTPGHEKVVLEDEAYGYYERLLKRFLSFPFLGILFWCYGDYKGSIWEKLPICENQHERYFGFFREDRSPKLFLSLLKEFKEKRQVKPPSLGWIDISKREYFKDPKAHLKRLYRRFKEQGME